MRRTLISMAICAWPALASAGPTRLTMQWVNGESTHLAGQRGAINRRADIKMAVELHDQQRLEVTDTGSTSDHNLYESFSTTEESTWTNQWSGTWKIRGRSLQLDLVLDDRKCTRTKTQTGAPPEALPCGAVSKQFQLACTTEQIPIEEWTGTVRKETRHEAWVCSATAAVALGQTASVWVLGKQTCLQTVGGRSSPIYQRCKP